MSSSPKISQGKLWILEDETDLRTVISYLATRKGYNVYSFASLQEGKEALQKARELGSESFPDFVISDLRLGDGNSHEWMLQVRKLFPAVLVMCLSGSLTQELSEELYEQGIFSMEKPASIAQILKLFMEAQSGKLKPDKT